MKNNECTILIMGRNASLKQIYLSSFFFRKYWSDCKYELVLCTQTKEPEHNLFDRIIYTDEEMIWGDRLKVALDEIETEFVFMMPEDYFLKTKVDSDAFENCIKFLREQNGGLVRLNPPVPFTKPYNKKFDYIPVKSIYRICGQPSIFKKSYLERFADKHYSPWQFEREGSLLSRTFPEKLFITKNVVFDCVHAWSRGMWLKDAYILMINEKIDKKYYSNDKVYPWYMRMKDNFCMILIRMFPEMITKVRILQCKRNDKKMKG